MSGVATITIRPYRSGATRARVASVLLGVAGIGAAVRLLAAVAGLIVFQQSTHTIVSSSTLDTVVWIWRASGVVYGVGAVACAIGFLAWLSRAVDNVPALGGGLPAASPRWAIAWWFIPLGNLGMPYEVVRDLRRRVSGEPTSGHPRLLIAWWLAFVLGDVLDAAATQLPADTTLTATRYLIVEVIACGLLVTAAVLAVLAVRQIERWAESRASGSLATVVGEGFDAALTSEAPAAPGSEPQSHRNWRMRPSWVSFVCLTGAFVVYFAALGIGRSGLFASDASPHEDPSLEASLPHSVMGRPLLVWSVRGRHLFVDVMGMDQAAVDQMTTNLAAVHLAMDDVSYAVAGRSVPEAPAYLVVAYHFRGLDLAQIGTFGIDHPDAGAWSTVSLAGKQVRKGAIGMYDQTTHLRGLPYVYDAQDVRYIVVTDDDAWAGDALRQLP